MLVTRQAVEAPPRVSPVTHMSRHNLPASEVGSSVFRRRFAARAIVLLLCVLSAMVVCRRHHAHAAGVLSSPHIAQGIGFDDVVRWLFTSLPASPRDSQVCMMSSVFHDVLLARRRAARLARQPAQRSRQPAGVAICQINTFFLLLHERYLVCAFPGKHCRLCAPSPARRRVAPRVEKSGGDRCVRGAWVGYR